VVLSLCGWHWLDVYLLFLVVFVWVDRWLCWARLFFFICKGPLDLFLVGIRWWKHKCYLLRRVTKIYKRIDCWSFLVFSFLIALSFWCMFYFYLFYWWLWLQIIFYFQYFWQHTPVLSYLYFGEASFANLLNNLVFLFKIKLDCILTNWGLELLPKWQIVEVE